jgi:phosphoribosylpyrophosphate synthetase
MSNLLFYCPSMERLAKAIEAQELGIELGKCYWNTFPDGWPNIRMPKVSGIRRMNVAFLMNLESPSEVFAQLSMAYALSARGAQDYKVILPYYPTGTNERGDSEGHVVTAKTLARMLSEVPLCRSGPVELVLYDIHTLAQRNYFGNNIVTRYKTGTKYLKKALENDPDAVIAFPDFGAYKRFEFAFDGNRKKIEDEVRRIRELAGHYGEDAKHAAMSEELLESEENDADEDLDPQEDDAGEDLDLEQTISELIGRIGKDDREFPMIVCEKRRGAGDERKVHVREGDPSGKHVVIVDDIIRSGGTIIECKNALMEAGAAKVSAFATHGAFTDDSWKKFIDAGFHKVWITDSIPSTVKKVEGKEPFEILSLAASIARVIIEQQQ